MTNTAAAPSRADLGYILLEQCDVLLHGSAHHLRRIDSWHAIDLGIENNDNCNENRSTHPNHCQAATEAAVSGRASCSHGNGQRCNACHHIILNIDGNDDDDDDRPGNSPFKLRLAHAVPRFHGMVDEMYPHCGAQTLTASTMACNENGDDVRSAIGSQRRKRSDVSLMLGLVLACQDLGHVRINTANLVLHPSDADCMEDDISNDNDTVRRRCSIVLTLTFPALIDALGTATKDGPSKPPIGIRPQPPNAKVRCAKPLPYSTQLLLTLIRSDWDHLDAEMEHLAIATCDSMSKDGMKCGSTRSDDASQSSRSIGTTGRTRQQQSDFFPQQFSLEVVYQHIRGASRHLNDKRHARTTEAMHDHQSHSSTTRLLTNLPKDVLISNISTYLRAPSIRSLSNTCKILKYTLRGVVPGLKLNLFHHQIDSLAWMRSKEQIQLTERDILRSHVQSSPSMKGRVVVGDATEHGDPHRSASGGATVLLAPRPGVSMPVGVSPKIRLSQSTGLVYDETAVVSIDRSVARGGLLCDDPGLGKTITVLSLILQTIGMSSKIPAVDKVKSDNKSITGEPPVSMKRSLRNKRAKSMPSAAEHKTPKISRSSSPTPSALSSTSLSLSLPSASSIFEAYWREEVVPEFRCPALNRIIARLMRSNRASSTFLHPVDPVRDGCPDYFDVITHPISISEIRRKNDSGAYGHDFQRFVADVDLCFRNAMVYNPSNHIIHQIATAMQRSFHRIVGQFKQEQVSIASRTFGRASSRPNSSVAALIEQDKRRNFMKALTPSSSTLMVVPSVLLDHWLEQIEMHVDLRYCCPHTPIIFQYDGTEASHLEMERIVFKCEVEKTHSAFLFVDKTNTRQLPCPKFLAMFTIVLTSTQRFSHEWKNGSFENEVNSPASIASFKYRDYEMMDTQMKEDNACSLLKVYWLRMIVDEGHSMGKNSKSSSICFASWICAQRRWAMTGTPTRRTSTHSGLTNIANLFSFLQHDFFSRRRDGDAVWHNLIHRGWNQGALCAFQRLKSLLSMFMVRHTKKDIEELPLPDVSTTVLPMSHEEITTYNTLVGAIQSNLLITSMEGRTSGTQDSLLHKSQVKHAQKALQNLRLVCVGGTRVLPTLTDAFWKEFVGDLGVHLGNEPEKEQRVLQYVQDALADKLSSCDCCKLALSMLLVFPCGCLVCTECADGGSDRCIVCDQQFDIDSFQKLQPGMDYQWLHNIEEGTAKKKRKMLMASLAAMTTTAGPNSGHTPADPRQGNPNVGSTRSGNYDPTTANSTINGSIGHGNIGANANDVGDTRRIQNDRAALHPQQQQQRQQRVVLNPGQSRSGNKHVCTYSRAAADGVCTVCRLEHGTCVLIKDDARCGICFKQAEKCPDTESKATHIVNKLAILCASSSRLRAQTKTVRHATSSQSHPRSHPRPLKVIIFSQFRIVLNMIGHRLLKRFGGGCVAEYWGRYRSQELHRFHHDDDCFCFLLGKDGSEGLDLSFVTHIFFMEKVFDRSLQEQAVARAWRMGAKGSVKVETLIAQDSVEETMQQMDESRDDIVPRSATETFQAAKVHYLLKTVRLIANPYVMSFGRDGGKRKADLTPLKAGSDSAMKMEMGTEESVVSGYGDRSSAKIPAAIASAAAEVTRERETSDDTKAQARREGKQGSARKRARFDV